MTYGLPTIGEANWGQKILDSINAVKTTADAALPATQKGAASGVAPLGADSRVGDANLPTRLAAAVRANLTGNESVRITNGGSNHAIFEIGSNSWAVNVNNATGDFRITRLTGTGRLLITNELETRRTPQPRRHHGRVLRSNTRDQGRQPRHRHGR